MPPIDPVTAQRLKDAGFDLTGATDPGLPLQPPSPPAAAPTQPGVNNPSSTLSTAANSKPDSAALAGLIASQNQPGFAPSTSELYGLANRDPQTVAPGSNQYFQHLLDESNKQDNFKQQLSNQGDEANNVAQLQGFLGAGGTPSQPAQQMAIAGRQAEAAKINAPLQVEQARAASAENIARIGAASKEQQYLQLMETLKNPAFAGNPIAALTGGASPHVSFQTPAQQFPSGPAGTEKVRLQKQLDELENPGLIGGLENKGFDAVANFLGLTNSTTAAKAARTRARLGLPTTSGVPGAQATPATPPQAAPIIQHSPSTGKTRISYDGGNTWQQQ